MKAIIPVLPLHLLGTPCYGADCTLAVLHGYVTTPWNRITIPRRCAPCMDAQVSQSQDVLERPLTCTTTNAHSTPSN